MVQSAVADTETDTATSKDPLDVLERHFGFRQFLSGQERVVTALVSGRDALVVMPTGGGKSLCYQLPAMVMDGVTLVISPLIALMKDQVDGLERKGIPATMINSTLSPAEQRERIDKMQEGAYKLVYIAPERFRSRSFVNALKNGVDIALFAVDEAHCLSQWGHDFRPDYLRLGNALAELGMPQTAAFTATATPEVRDDILKCLGLREPFVSVSGFERPNLSLRVIHCEKQKQKFERLRDLIRDQRTGIVYCATRKRVNEVTDVLASMGIKVVAYHGGMDEKEREEAQNLFINRSRDVAVATNAFGMGIDRPDVRFVAHFDIPGSVEAYYQEAGRAGRDGEPAVCELLFNYADTRTQEFFIEGNNPGYSLICDVYRTLQRLADNAYEVVLPIRQLTDAVGAKNDMSVSSALSLLSREGYLGRYDVPGSRARGTRLLKPDVPPEELEIDRDALKEKSDRDRGKLDAMVKLAYSLDCRQLWILQYFGEKESTPCGSCDRCLEGGAHERREPNADEFTILRKALSGVARCSNRSASGGWEGRFGKGKIVQMLVGSRSQEVLNARLDELSTYGILKPEGAPYVYALLREMEGVGLLESSKGEYPLVTLTPKGAEAMRGKFRPRILWPERDRLRPKALTTGPDSPDELGLEEVAFDRELFEKLKRARADLAREEGDVPVYRIFTNQTLEFFTRLRPTSLEAARHIRGVGEVKVEKYVPAILEVIRGHVGS